MAEKAMDETTGSKKGRDRRLSRRYEVSTDGWKKNGLTYG